MAPRFPFTHKASLLNTTTQDDASMRGARLIGNDLSGRDWEGRELVLCDFSGSNLRQANLTGACAHAIRLRNADLNALVATALEARDSDWEGANANNADLGGADLRGAVFLDAQLEGANLNKADLRGADLRNANLRGADLRDADLRKADLNGADLTDARLTGARLQGARLSGFRSAPTATESFLLQSGAYRGFPPAIHNIGVRGAQAAHQSSQAITGAWTFLRNQPARLSEVEQWTKETWDDFKTNIRTREERETLKKSVRDEEKSLADAIKKAKKAASKRAQTSLNESKAVQAELIAEDKALRKAAIEQAKQQRATFRTELQQRKKEAKLAIRAVREQAKEARRQKEANLARQRLVYPPRIQNIPGGPGANLTTHDLKNASLSGAPWSDAQLLSADLSGARLQAADLNRAQLQSANLTRANLLEATLDHAQLGGATFNQSRMRNCSLVYAQGRRSTFVDADLRNANLTNANLEGADLTGADLSNAVLQNANLSDANLTAARMCNVSLDGAILSNTKFDQADLTGATWGTANVTRTKLTGALGITTVQREHLKAAGAIEEGSGFDALMSRYASRQIRSAVAVLGLGIAAYLSARFFAEGSYVPTQMEEQAELLRHEDPLKASEAYEALADAAPRLDDRVGYLLEAAALSERANRQPTEETASNKLTHARTEKILKRALKEAGDDPSLSAGVRIHLGAFLLELDRWDECVEAIEPLLDEDGQPAEVKARAILLQQRAQIEGKDFDLETFQDLNAAVLEQTADLPDVQTDLRIALAEVLSSQGLADLALKQVQLASELNLSQDQNTRLLQTQARIEDRAGYVEAATTSWSNLIDQTEPNSVAWLAASLALADLEHRRGAPEMAAKRIEPLLHEDVDPRVRGRAWLVQGRLNEQQSDLDGAALAYQRVLGVDNAEAETRDEARVSLARVLLADGTNGPAEEALANLPDDARAVVLAHARLGEARHRLQLGDPSGSIPLFQTVLDESSNLPTQSRDELVRIARSGKAEALSQTDALPAAIKIWRSLLTQDLAKEERLNIELALAHGLLQGGRRDEAATAFRSLAQSADSEKLSQALIGLAEVALANGERERARVHFQDVARQSEDPAWRVYALSELADMASEDGREEDALESWRAILGVVPPGHPAANTARLAVIQALTEHLPTMMEANESEQLVNQAINLCNQTRSTTSDVVALSTVELACAEILERTGRLPEALSSYRKSLTGHGVTSMPESSDGPLRDAALGWSRVARQLGQHEGAMVSLETGLQQVRQPASKLALVTAMVAIMLEHNTDANTLAQTLLIEQELSKQAPDLAVPVLVDAAQQAKAAGNIERAQELLNTAANLDAASGSLSMALLELADLQLEQHNPPAAIATYARVTALDDADSHDGFWATMGIAEAQRQSGELEDAIQTLRAAEPPDHSAMVWRQEALAGVLSQAGERDATKAWSALADMAEDEPELLSTALQGEAKQWLEGDAPDRAEALFSDAVQVTSDPVARGWAQLGRADALIAQGKTDDAARLTASLLQIDDAEVSLQATITLARIAVTQGQWQDAINLLEHTAPWQLGPGWDTTVADIRTQAHIGAGEVGMATKTWRDLGARWPSEEEAQLPVMLGQARIAWVSGDMDEAKKFANQAKLAAVDPAYKLQAEELLLSMAQ